MRVLQLIDSLNSGGAERMAITFANELSSHISKSFLSCTREEGLLKDTIHDKVAYCFLGKKWTLDFLFFYRLFRLVKKNKIQIIHAHSSSFFSATVLKLFIPSLKLIWHEHHGNRITQTRLNNLALYFSSHFFNAIITVNKDLSVWCEDNLLTNHVVYIPNGVFFPYIPFENDIRRNEIICVANFRVPKNHLNLLKSFNRIHKEFQDWKLILIGKVKNDDYYLDVSEYINENNLNSSVEILGERSDVYERMMKAKIGVLASDMEGLPITLLEYGVSNLAVITTQVGDCPEVIQDYGLIVPPKDDIALSKAISTYITCKNKRKKDSISFNNHIKINYSLESVLPKILTVYQKVNYQDT